MPNEKQSESVQPWTGTLTEFVRKHGDFTASHVRPHLGELLRLARDAELNPSLATLAGTYYAEKRKRAKQAEASRAPHAEPVAAAAPHRRRRPRYLPALVEAPVAAENQAGPVPDLNETVEQVVAMLRAIETERAQLRSMLLAIKQVLEGPPPEQPAE